MYIGLYQWNDHITIFPHVNTGISQYVKDRKILVAYLCWIKLKWQTDAKSYMALEAI